MNRLRTFAAFIVLMGTLIGIPGQAGALAGGIDGCFFRDLNGSSTQGDNANVGAADESPFTAPITVELVDLAASSSITVTTDPITGCFEFPALTDATNYRINVTYPAEYYSSPTGGDTDFVPGAPPIVAGDPFTSRYDFTYSTGDDLSVSGGVSGLPELSLGYFITPGGDPMIETGTGPFDTTGNCPTQAPGDDCGTYDDVVRTNDITTIGYTITADNIPDGNTNPLNDVVLEQVITPGPNAVVEVPSLHPNCLTTGVSPVSSIAVDPGTGVITVTCNLGSKDNGTSIIPTYIRTDGASENDSTFTVDARVYTGDDRAQVFDDTSMLDTTEIRVSAAPRFDITKGNDSSNPFNRVVYYQTTERVNPVTGVTEYGVNYQWDISVIYDGGAKGQAALVDPITFSDIIPPEFSGWDIVACNSTPYGSGNMPNDDRPEEDWGARGTWSCAEDRANNEIDITVTGADTDGNPIPTEGTNGNNLAAGPYFAFAGSVRIWYPLSDFYKTIDPTWTEGDDPITGDYTLDNVVGNFDPEDATGQSNFGDPENEPLENNDRSVNVAIYERGGFSKHLGSYEWADARIPDASLEGTASLWPCSASSIVQGSLMSGQTQACSQGDAPVQPGEKAHFWFWLRNDGTFPWDSETVELCDAFDNSTMSLTTWTGGEPVYGRIGIPAGAMIVEYATAGFNDNVVGNSWANQVSAVQTCTAPNNDWSADPLSFDPDPTTSLESIGMIRVRFDETVVDQILPSQYVQMSFPVEVRDTFNGGPNDGEPIPVGTILANNANRKFGTTDYSATHMNAETYENSPWGDRLFLNRHQVRISKTTSIDPTSPTDDDLFNVQGSDTVVWWLQPAVTAVTPATATNVQVIDTLPAGISFDAFCQASQPYPDANVVLTSVTNNPDGTTTLLFDLGDRPTNVAIGPIPVCTSVDSFLDPGTDLTNNVEITSDGDVSPESTRTADRTISVVASGEFQLTKDVDAPLELQLDTQTYTIGWTNLSTDFDFSPPDVIDVWPYNGDAVNPLNQRTEFDSNYSGSYELTAWMPPPTTTLADGSTEVTGGTWYYSSDDPNTIPYDADDPINDLATGSVTWCTQADLVAAVAPCDFTFSDSTAVRFVQTDVLVSESTVTVGYTFQAGTALDPNQPADRYVNRFAARTDSVDDLIRSNEVLVQVLSMNLGDLVFLDADVDGMFTSGIDVPIQGTVVELWLDDGTGTFTFQQTTTTDANGRYFFDDLLQGTYEVRIPDAELSGGTLDTWTQTINPLPADDDINEDGDQQAFDSGLGYTSSGPVTLAANTVVDPPLGLEPNGENLFNLGNPYTFDNLSNMSVDLGFRGDPDVQIIKEVCDTALGTCDLTTDPLDPADGWVETVVVPFTDSAVWRITVLNTGDEMLTDIAIDDDIEDSCDQATGAIGNLGIGESFSWICSTDNVVEDQLNTASVDAFGIGSGVEVNDDDSAAAETPPLDRDIEVIKYVNGDDAQTAPGIYIDPGSPVTFTYEVTTGAGTVPLHSVSVSDDNGTPTDLTDDFSAGYVSGDTDTDTILDLGETWVFEATGFTAATGQYANWATGRGVAVTPDATNLSDLDPAHYYGVDGGVALTKFVNGQDANTAPGVLVADGAAVTFTYELRNTGNIELTVESFTDDAGTPGNVADDWTPTYVSGDTDLDNELDINEVWLYEHTGEVADVDLYTNTADVIAEDPIGNEFPASDPANYFGSDPSMTLEKSTNTVDADVDSVMVAANGPVVWEYELENTGNVRISNPRVEDDGGTPADPSDDFFAAYVSGDTNNDGFLDVDETWIFRANGTATESAYRNNAVATGRAPETTDESGDPVPGESLEAEDPSGYVTADPGIAIVKSTNGVDNTSAPGVYIAIGDPVTWTYEVTNTGDVPLSAVMVVDDNGTPADATDDVTAAYVSGDTNTDTLLDVDETWTFEATGTATADQYGNNAEVEGTPPTVTNPDGSETTPDPVTDDDDDFYFGSDPEIAITKSTNTVDNTTAPGVYIPLGGAVTWTYEVTNPGNVALSNVTVVDDNGTPADATDDVTAAYVSGDTNTDTILDLDETWIFEATGTAIADQYENLATVSGTPPTVTNPDGSETTPDPVTDDDDDFYFGSDPEIAITKSTNTVDNTVAPGVYITPGDPVTWTYEVTNPGNVALSNVTVVDDNGTPGDATDDVTAAYVSGDANTDTFLDTDETWIFEATGTAVAGQYENNAEVEGTPPTETTPDGSETTPDPVVDDDDDFYFGSTPDIAITKSTNTVDNTSAPGVYIAPGDPVTWTYAVTNPGDVPLSSVTVVDDNGTPADATDDVTAAYVSGDSDNDTLLDTDETWIFEATGTATAGQYENNAEVEGTPPVVTNPDGSTTTPDPVTDDDDDFYYGFTPEIAITKSTNGVDNTSAPGVYVPLGGAVTWTYEVTNPGDVPLSNVTVVDDNGTPADATDDVTAAYVSGDTNTDTILDLDETWIFEATGTAIADQYENNAEVEGTPPVVTNPDGSETTPDPVTDDDDDFYFGSDPEIAIAKSTNTVDSTTAPGVYITPGDPVTWTYEITNPGNVALSNVTVVDDNGTPADAADDVTAAYVSGDANNDTLLDTDETWIFEAAGTATAGQYENNAEVEGTPPTETTPDGSETTPNPVEDDDDDFYFGSGPGIGITKSTNGVDNTSAPGVYVPLGGAITWSYEVVNVGDVALSGVTVVDDNGTPADAADDVTAAYVSGDANNDTLLDTDETWIFEATGTATADQYENLATVTGTPPIVTNPDGSTTTPDPVSDDDDDFYFGSDPAIAVTKSTNGTDNTEATGPFVLVGDAVTWTYEVTNPGNVALSDVVVVDDNGTPADPTDDLTGTYVSGDLNDDTLLDTDETWIFEASGVAIEGQYENLATASGTPPTETTPDGSETTPDPVEDDDDDFYWGSNPSVEIIKSVNGDDANIAPGLLLPNGDEVSWTYSVTNTGNTPLIDLVVTDDMGVVVTCPATFLDVGESMECTGPAEPSILGQYTNIGTVTGTPAEPTGDPDDPFSAIIDPETGGPVGTIEDDDPANYFGTGPGIEIEKEVCNRDNPVACYAEDDANWTEVTVVSDGETAVWRMTVTNTGNVDLQNIVVTDPLAPGCDATRALLEVGNVWVFTCELENVTEPTTNIAFVEATPTTDPDGPPVEDDDTAETVEPAELELDKDVDDSSVFVGDTVTYTLEITNSGVTDAVDVEVLDTLPSGLTNIAVPAGSGLVYNASTNTLTWSIASLPVGTTQSVSYTATVSGTGSLLNEAEILSDHQENDLTNNEDTVSISAEPTPTPTPLAFTGSNSRSMVSSALLLMLFGAGFVFFARRRRADQD